MHSKILIAEDATLVREALMVQLQGANDLVVVGQSASVAGTLELLALMPDLVLVDMQLVDGSGLDIVREVRERKELERTRCLVLTIFDDKESCLAAVEAGADGYVLKDSALVDILPSIYATLKGGAPLSPSVAGHLSARLRELETLETLPQPLLVSLSPREQQVLNLMSRGLEQKMMARVLDISPNTVSKHVASILHKLNVSSSSEAIYAAARAGLLDL